MSLFKRNDFWEERFSALAYFNDEIYRGLVHSQEYVERMKKLQEEYNNKLFKYYHDNG